LTFSDSLSQQLQQQIQQFDLPDTFMQGVEQYLLQLAEHIATQARSLGRCSLISINGSQGSGKSTMTVFLKLILQHHFNLSSAVVSIDDFYLTLAQRKQLAQQVHPLFVTRGVPGTHDIELAKNTLQSLKNCSAQSPCRIPVFDKSIDDRADESLWPLLDSPVDVILFEGWCNHAPLQSEQELKTPINDLEKNEDEKAVWRNYVNQQLHQYHINLFSQADSLVFMQIPSFEKVYEWRGLQEHKLKKAAAESSQGVMDQQQLIRFIQHYERITRSCLKGLPATADIILKIDNDHRIQSMQIVGSTN
jgi:D-glycerate 3-kinase